MWRPRRPIVRISSNVPILGHTQPRLPGARCWCHCRMGWCPHRPGLCCSSLCSTWSCHHYDGSYQRTWTGFLAAFRIRNMSLGKYFDGCIACENAFCSTAFFEEGIRIIIGFEALERNVIENAELPEVSWWESRGLEEEHTSLLWFDFCCTLSLLTTSRLLIVIYKLVQKRG